MSTSSLFSAVLEGIVKGIVSSLLPGVHPILLSFSSEMPSSIAYGIYATLSDVQSAFLGAFSAGAVYVSIVSLRMAAGGRGRYAVFLYLAGCIFGLLLSILYFPISDVLSIRIPKIFVFVFLLFLSALLLVRSKNVRTLLVVVLASVFGYAVLKLPIPVRDPLQIAIAGLFGASTVLLSSIFHRSVPLGSSGSVPFHSALYASIMGLLMGLFVSYFPAVSLSVVAFLLHPFFLPSSEEILIASGSASSAALLFSAKGRSAGMVRTSFAATLDENVFLPRVVSGLAFGISLGAILALTCVSLLHRLYTARKMKLVAISVLLVLSFLRSGIPGVLLFISSVSLGMLPHLLGVEKRTLMFFLLFPTLLHYAPM